MQIKLLLGAGLVFSILLLGKIACDKQELSSTNSKLNEELMKANLEIGKAHTRFGEANRYVKELEQVIQDEIKKNNAKATMVGKLKARLRVVKNLKRKTKIIYKNKNTIISKDLDLTPGLLYQAISTNELKEVDRIPVNYIDHRLNFQGDIISYENIDSKARLKGNYKLTLNVAATIVKTIAPTGAVNNYISIYEIDDKDRKIAKFDVVNYDVVVVDERKERLSYWVPRIDLGISTTTSLSSQLYGISVGVSFMGYGKSEDRLKWRFVRPSLEVSDTTAIGFSAFSYNVGTLLPLFSNLWISPHMNREINTNKYRIGFVLGAVL